MENKKSFFQFENFIINKSIFDLKKGLEVKDLSIDFNPSGRLNFEGGKFELNLGVIISDEKDRLNIEVDSMGFFTFENLDKDDLSNFLYINAPAILFPYLRAYISSLTTLSGLKPIILPTLNLSSLKEELAANIEEELF